MMANEDTSAPRTLMGEDVLNAIRVDRDGWSFTSTIVQRVTQLEGLEQATTDDVRDALEKCVENGLVRRDDDNSVANNIAWAVIAE